MASQPTIALVEFDFLGGSVRLLRPPARSSADTSIDAADLHHAIEFGQLAMESGGLAFNVARRSNRNIIQPIDTSTLLKEPCRRATIHTRSSGSLSAMAKRFSTIPTPRNVSMLLREPRRATIHTRSSGSLSAPTSCPLTYQGQHQPKPTGASAMQGKGSSLISATSFPAPSQRALGRHRKLPSCGKREPHRDPPRLLVAWHLVFSRRR